MAKGQGAEGQGAEGHGSEGRVTGEQMSRRIGHDFRYKGSVEQVAEGPGADDPEAEGRRSEGQRADGLESEVEEDD